MDKRGLLREAGAVVVGQVGVAVASLAALRIVTEILDTSVYGKVALILASLKLVKGIFISPTLSAQLRFHPVARTEGSSVVLYAAVFLLVGAGVVTASVLGLVAVLALGGTWYFLALIVGVSWLVVDGAIGCVVNFLNAECRQGQLAVLRVADACLRPAFGVAVAVLCLSSAWAYVGGRLLGASLLLGLVSVAMVLRAEHGTFGRLRSSARGSRVWFGRLVKYAAPLIPVSTILWAVHLGDRYLLEIFHGSSQVGVYSAAYGLASQPYIMLGGVATLLFRPRMFKAMEAQRSLAESYRQAWFYLLLSVGGIGIVLLGLLHKVVGRIFLAEAYRQGSSLLLIVGLAYFLFAIGQVYENWAFAEKRTRHVLAAAITSLIVSAITALSLIPTYAALGAAWSTVLGLGAYTGVMWLTARRLGKL